MALHWERIETAIAPLLADGWSVEQIRERRENVESKELVLSIGEISARFVSCHGQFFADVGGLGARGGWYNLKDVLRAAGDDIPGGPLADPGQAVALLRGAAQKVGACLKNPAIMSRLGVRWAAPPDGSKRS
jgi:hypothetical protein